MKNPFRDWTAFNVIQHNLRHGLVQGSPASEPVNRESILHDQIQEECQKRDWLCVHSRMDRRSTNQLGTPDFIIAAPEARTLWIEAKRPGGKLRPEQREVGARLAKRGHEFHVVTSFEEFLKLL